jgi:bis(5'-nucleosyl)-tetraphosphatase (symmetrical)
MAVYAVGDVQGCRESLEALLDELRFDPGRDRLLLVGDLVNRGPDSAGVLRLVRALGAAAGTVLGNHDLNLLAVAAGVRAMKRRDTVAALLEAADAAELLDWLRHQPLLIELPQVAAVVVHAGLHPAWTLNRAKALASEIERALTGPDGTAYLRSMFGDQPAAWSDGLTGWGRLRLATNVFTRMRYLDGDGALELTEVGPPGMHPAHLRPWYEFARTGEPGTTIVFGHWSALGARLLDGAIALDSGCVWGGRLTAVRLDTVPVSLHSIEAREKGSAT